MNPLLFPFAVVCSLGLAAVAVSFLAILQNASSSRALDARAKTRQAQWEAALQSTNEAVKELTTQMQQIEAQSFPSPVPRLRPGFNLSTRSQALRMHRRGEGAPQIAAALQVSVQEVELLLKVHQIVLQNLATTAIPGAAAGAKAARAGL
jgi:hypothetical protein